MIRLVLASALLLALSACGKKQEAAAPVAGGGPATATAASGGASVPGDNPADWTDRWWKSDNPEYDKGPFVDIDATTPVHEHFTITFKKDVNDGGHKADAIATPEGRTLPFVLDGQHKSFAIVIGKDTGVAALAARRRCVILSPDKTIYCLD